MKDLFEELDRAHRLDETFEDQTEENNNEITQDEIPDIIDKNVAIPEDKWGFGSLLHDFKCADRDGKLTMVWRLKSESGYDLNELTPKIVEFVESLRNFVTTKLPQYKIQKLVHNKKEFYRMNGRYNYYEDVRLVLSVPDMRTIVDPKLHVKDLVAHMSWPTKCLQARGDVANWDGVKLWIDTVKRSDSYCLRISTTDADKSNQLFNLETYIDDYLTKNKLDHSCTSRNGKSLYVYVQSANN